MHIVQLQSIDSCLQAAFRAGIGGSARKQAESLYNHYEEVHFRWGLASFFAGLTNSKGRVRGGCVVTPQGSIFEV